MDSGLLRQLVRSHSSHSLDDRVMIFLFAVQLCDLNWMLPLSSLCQRGRPVASPYLCVCPVSAAVVKFKEFKVAPKLKAACVSYAFQVNVSQFFPVWYISVLNSYNLATLSVRLSCMPVVLLTGGCTEIYPISSLKEILTSVWLTLPHVKYFLLCNRESSCIVPKRL